MFLASKKNGVNRLYCSKRCQLEFGNVTVECEFCYKKFTVPKHRQHTAKYCSKQCYHSVSRRGTICSICGEKFDRCEWEIRSNKKRVKTNTSKNYCSVECYKKRSPKTKEKCSGCNKEIWVYPSRKRYYGSLYCSNKCKMQYGIIGKLTDSLNFNSQYDRFVRSLRSTAKYHIWKKQCLERDGYACVLCKCDKRITVHHVKVSMYDFVKKHGFNRQNIDDDPMFFDVDNGCAMCRNCHLRAHIRR